MAVRPVSSGAPDVSAPAQEATWVVQPGDTLSAIARQLQRTGTPGTAAELVRTLARLNRLSDPDRISVGQVLTLPSRPGRPCDEDVVGVVEADVLHGLQNMRMHVGEQKTRLENALLGLLHRVPTDPVPRQESSDTPFFRQSDPAWRTERLGISGEGPTLAQAGCAVTACAMALSRIGGTVLTPDALVRHLRDSGGFQGPLLDWSAAGSAIHEGPRATPGALDSAGLDRELDAGRPVLLRVVHEVQGRPRQHWICLTGRDRGTGEYTANDPATGRSTALTRAGTGLATLGGEPVQYTSDGRMVTFVRGTT
ncbi:MAG TPA: LysM peptidoglycan-binding domain-containing protein [Myxococcaceae bacterium]|jgi:LysM repeat protein